MFQNKVFLKRCSSPKDLCYTYYHLRNIADLCISPHFSEVPAHGDNEACYYHFRNSSVFLQVATHPTDSGWELKHFRNLSLQKLITSEFRPFLVSALTGKILMLQKLITSEIQYYMGGEATTWHTSPTADVLCVNVLWGPRQTRDDLSLQKLMLTILGF